MEEIRKLSELYGEEEGVIVEVDGGFGLKRRLACLGIRIGKKVRKVASEPFRGPIVVEVDGAQLALGRGVAEKILVKVGE
ncbi:ferrous iron transport protein A [Candidatus Bathyarchaeota archaeon]|nr:MAG: ferrous iron transport protein A [Candidatus Bathyarchaeota archaeon]